jgi:hypothetical protein
MSEELSVSLGNSLFMSIVEHVNYGTGVITYTVKGKRLSGSVTLYPRYSNNTEITPSRVVVESGNRPSRDERKDILTINGIPIECRQSLDLEGKQCQKQYCRLSRLGLAGWENRLPDATRRYAEDVLEALASLWSKRTDIADLRHVNLPPSFKRCVPHWPHQRNAPLTTASLSKNIRLNP